MVFLSVLFFVCVFLSAYHFSFSCVCVRVWARCNITVAYMRHGPISTIVLVCIFFFFSSWVCRFNFD